MSGEQKRPRLPVLMGALVIGGALLGGFVPPTAAMAVELGVTGGGGMALMYGSMLDEKAETVSLLGSSGPGAMGYSQFVFFPGWTAGVYAETPLLGWLALRVEAWYESSGAARTGFTSGGSAFDVYGVYFSSVEIPIGVRAHFPMGPGEISAILGPYLGIIAGDVTLVDRSATTSTTAVITPDLAHRFFFGLAGGAAWSFRIGPGRATLELRADWAILSANASGDSGGNLNPIGLSLVAGYGVQLGDFSNGARR